MGVRSCIKCKLVTFTEGLKSQINYESGSMYDWASGYGQSLESPKQDLLLRTSAIIELAKEHLMESILDFGSGRGEMLREFNVHYQVSGLEPDSTARAK